MQPILNIAMRAARRAGQIIVTSIDQIEKLKVEEKGRNDLVSEVDRDAEAAVIDIIRKSYPEHKILGEESGLSEGSEDVTWIVDPLDGTTNFLYGIPHYCVSIGIMQGKQLEHGLIYDPLRNEVFSASRGQGAHLEGKRIRVRATDTLSSAVLTTGMPFSAVEAHQPAFDEMVSTFTGQCRTIRRTGSAALDLAYVACGRFDAFFELALKPWDMAAGALLVREAGGFVGDIAGGDRFMETGNVVAATPKLFKDVVRVCRSASRNHSDAKLLAG